MIKEEKLLQFSNLNIIVKIQSLRNKIKQIRGLVEITFKMLSTTQGVH